MTKRDIVSVALKVIGVYLLATAVGTLPRSIETVRVIVGKHFNAPDPTGWLVSEVASTLLWFLVGGGLVAFADRIAGAIADASEQTLHLASEQSEQVFVLAIRVLGVVVLVNVLPDLLSTFARTWMVHASLTGEVRVDPGYLARELWVTQWTTIVKAAISAAIGVYLVWGAKQFGSLVFASRKQNAVEAQQDA